MSNICIRVNDYVSPFASSLPKIESSDIVYADRFEQNAYEHWMFNNSADSLIGEVNDRLLSAQPTTVYPVTFGDKFVNISAAKGNSLQSSLSDSGPLTMAGVMKVEDSNLRVLMGTLSGNDGDVLGIGMFASAGKLYVTSRGGASSVTDNAPIDISKPFFAAFSFDPASASLKIVTYQNGNFGQIDRNSVLNPSNAPLSFGNSRYTTSATYNAFKNAFYEGIIFDSALSIDQMKAIALRVKTRQAHYGVEF